MSDEFTIPSGENRDPWFNAVERKAEERREETHGMARDEMALQYAKCFGTRAGRIVMQDILGYAFSQAGFNPNLGFFDGAAHGFYRQGMGDLVSEIHRKVAAGQAAVKRGTQT